MAARTFDGATSQRVRRAYFKSSSYGRNWRVLERNRGDFPALPQSARLFAGRLERLPIVAGVVRLIRGRTTIGVPSPFFIHRDQGLKFLLVQIELGPESRFQQVSDAGVYCRSETDFHKCFTVDALMHAYRNSTQEIQDNRRCESQFLPVCLVRPAAEERRIQTIALPRYHHFVKDQGGRQNRRRATGKGHAELIECWPSVIARVPNARLLVVGGGKGRADLEAAAAQSPASGQIEFTGFVPEAEIGRIWNRAHLLVMPSRQEGFGMVYIEAMRRGLPVIASRHDAGQEVNVDGETGFNVDLDRPGELADRIARLLGNDALCAAMGAAGRRRWRTHFRYSAFRSRLSQHLARFLQADTLSAEAASGRPLA